MAEDLSPPPWAGASQTGYVYWEFNEEIVNYGVDGGDQPSSVYCDPPYHYVPELTAPEFGFRYYGIETTNLAFIWHAGVGLNGDGSVTENLEESLVMSIPDGTGANITVYAQITWKGTWVPDYGLGLGLEVWSDSSFLDTVFPDMDPIEENDLGDGWTHSVFQQTFSTSYDPGGDVAYVHVLLGSDAGNQTAYFDQVVVDMIIHDGEIENVPAGPGHEPCKHGPTNPRPEDGYPRVDPDNLKLIWDKDPAATASTEHVYFDDDWDDVNDRKTVADKGIQDPNYYPTVGELNDVCALQLGKTFYWAVDEANVPDAETFYGEVWSFTIKDANAGLPDPENGQDGVGPCPTLTWDPGYDANEHYVYFSDIEAQVSGRTKDPCATLTEPTAETYSPGPLAYDTEYFWAVDENDVCDVLHSGPLWSFKTGPDPCTAPVQRSSGNSLYAMWGFDSDWGSGKTVADPCWAVPADPNFDANSVDDPCDWLASYTPAGGSSRSGIADNNGPAGVAGENSIRLKHTDYAIPGQTVTVLAELVWSGESAPGVILERLSGWGDNPEAAGGSPDPAYSFELCDGWMCSWYQAEFELVQPADNIHVVVETDGDFYLDYVEVDAWWRTPLVAHDPDPCDGDVNTPLGFGKLTWRPGLYADKHDVYFGTDEGALPLISDNQDPNYYPPTAGSVSVNPGTTYYWRVDEVNDACDPCLWPGQVWSFTTIPYIVIEDFETYAGASELYAVWEDWHSLPEQGGESILQGGGPPLAHGGAQALKFVYNHSYGEPVVRRTYSTPQDFSSGGLAALWMWIYGDANNAGTVAAGMYIELGDDDNSDGTVDDMAKIYYGDPRTYSSSPYGDANDLWRKTYYQWGVALEDFNDDNNVNPDKIKTISFGVNGGDSGQIYYDDLRLYVPRCITAFALPFGNLVDPEEGLDCFVDRSDLGAFSDTWLMSDIYVQSVAPGDANLLVHYVFDDVNLLNDVSGNNYHGVAINDVNVHDGILTLVNRPPDEDGNPPADVNAVEIGGTFMADTGNPFRGVVKGGGDFSIAMEFRTAVPSILFSSCPYAPDANNANPGDADHAMGLFILDFPGDDPPILSYDTWNIAASGAPGNPMDGRWHHVVTTYDADTNDHVTYLDGVPGEAESFDPNLIDPCDHKIRIGDTMHPIFPYEEATGDLTGDIDNVRVYDKVLSHGEVVYLMSTPAGEWFHAPVPSPAELHTSEPPGQQYVNFRDEAVLANNWLKSFLWPQNVP
jgi:hypothetical protein